jgi:hypothetical protein
MATTLLLRDFLGRDLQNATPGTTDPALDFMGRAVGASDVDYQGVDLISEARANSHAVTLGEFLDFASGNLYKVTGAGTTAASEPSESGIDIGDPLTDGTATLERIF